MTAGERNITQYLFDFVFFFFTNTYLHMSYRHFLGMIYSQNIWLILKYYFIKVLDSTFMITFMNFSQNSKKLH